MRDGTSLIRATERNRLQHETLQFNTVLFSQSIMFGIAFCFLFLGAMYNDCFLPTEAANTGLKYDSVKKQIKTFSKIDN